MGGLRRRLKNGAIPSIFDFPLHLQKQQTKRRKIIVRNKVRKQLIWGNIILIPSKTTKKVKNCDDLADLKGTNQILPASEDMSFQQVITLFIKVGNVIIDI